MDSDFFTHIWDLLASSFTARNFPFWTIVLVLALAGVFFSRKVWTKDYAYRAWKWRWFFRVGRETQALHPMLTGALWMALWDDPMGYGWGLGDNASYGLLAGGLSLFPWALVKLYAKRHHGVDLEDFIPGFRTSEVRLKQAQVLDDAKRMHDRVDELQAAEKRESENPEAP